MDYIDLYETRILLEDLVKVVEAANFNAYADKMSREDFDRVCAIDPTPMKTYAKWLLIQFLKVKKVSDEAGGDPEPLRLFFEDSYRATDALRLLEACKRAKPEGINLDIMTYKTIDDLYNAMLPFKGKEETMTSKSGAEKNIIPIYEDEHWRILIPKTHEAARKYGAYTHWCTATENSHYYDSYTRSGPLIIIINKDRASKITNASQVPPMRKFEGAKSYKWQIHLSSNQFKSASDCEVNDNDEDNRSKIIDMLPEAAQEKLFKLGINKYTYALMSMFEYSRRDDANEAKVRQLIAKGANPHFNDEVILRWAVQNHIEDLVDQFIADPHTEKKALADMVADAAKASDFNTVDKIVKAAGPGAINANGGRAFIAACEYPISSEDSTLYRKAMSAAHNNDSKYDRDLRVALGAFFRTDNLPPMRTPGTGAKETLDDSNLRRALERYTGQSYPKDRYPIKQVIAQAKQIAESQNAPMPIRVPPIQAIQNALGDQGMAKYAQLSEKVKEYYKEAFPIIQYFIERGADPNVQNGKALESLCMWNNEYVLQILEYLCSLKGKDGQPLLDVNINHSVAWWSAYNNYRKPVLELLKRFGGRAA